MGSFDPYYPKSRKGSDSAECDVLSKRVKGNGMKHFFDLVVYNAFAELKAENSRAMAGYLWWVLEPLMTLGVYYFIFEFFRPPGEGNFVVFLFTGIIFWRWFHAAVTRSVTSLEMNRTLMLQVDLNKSLLPLSIVIIDSIKFLVTLVLLLGTVFLTGGHVTPAWIQLPFLLATQFFLIIGCSLLVAGIPPLFQDFTHILNTLMMLMMFCSGLFYSLDILPEKVQTVLMFNPMAVLIDQYRRIFLEGEFVEALPMTIVWVESVIVFLLGFGLLKRFDKVYPKIS